jgi:hypothetical protein
MSTSFESIRNRFYRRIEKDKDFFAYYNISTDEAISIAKKQANGYLVDAIDKLTDLYSSTEIDFYDFDESLDQFNPTLTKKEIGLLVGLMYEIYFDRDLVLLKAFKIAMTPSDLNQFSPASERKTFTEMMDKIKSENIYNVDNYKSVDRITGVLKTIDHSKYEY